MEGLALCNLRNPEQLNVLAQALIARKNADDRANRDESGEKEDKESLVVVELR